MIQMNESEEMEVSLMLVRKRACLFIKKNLIWQFCTFILSSVLMFSPESDHLRQALKTL